jgi:hypothetical protein
MTLVSAKNCTEAIGLSPGVTEASILMSSVVVKKAPLVGHVIEMLGAEPPSPAWARESVGRRVAPSRAARRKDLTDVFIVEGSLAVVEGG